MSKWLWLRGALFCLSLPLFAQENVPFFHSNDVVVFQGDSITDGGRQRSGGDLNHTMGQDYAYILSAEIGLQHPELGITFINRGIGSERVVDLSARWQTDVLDLKPNVLSILIGVNDTLMSGDKAESVEQYEAVYDGLLAKTLAALPRIKIILCEPFLLPVAKNKDAYAAEIREIRKRQAVVSHLGEKYKVPVVKLQDAFDRASAEALPSYWCWDGIHPTYAGHALIVREWLKTATAFWPNK